LIAVVLDTAILAVACALLDIWVLTKLGVASGGELRITTAATLVGGSLDLLIAFLYLWELAL
jgi:hypothetical protein